MMVEERPVATGTFATNAFHFPKRIPLMPIVHSSPIEVSRPT